MDRNDDRSPQRGALTFPYDPDPNDPVGGPLEETTPSDFVGTIPSGDGFLADDLASDAPF